MLIELSLEELNLIGEALVNRSQHYRDAAVFLGETMAVGDAVKAIEAKRDAFMALHVKTLHARANDVPPAKRDPIPGDLIRGTRIVRWVQDSTKRYATAQWVSEPTSYPDDWKEVKLR